MMDLRDEIAEFASRYAKSDVYCRKELTLGFGFAHPRHERDTLLDISLGIYHNSQLKFSKSIKTVKIFRIRRQCF